MLRMHFHRMQHRILFTANGLVCRIKKLTHGLSHVRRSRLLGWKVNVSQRHGWRLMSMASNHFLWCACIHSLCSQNLLLCPPYSFSNQPPLCFLSGPFVLVLEATRTTAQWGTFTVVVCPPIAIICITIPAFWPHIIFFYQLGLDGNMTFHSKHKPSWGLSFYKTPRLKVFH